MTILTANWDLPTFEEQIHEIAPDVAAASEWQARHQMYQWIYELAASIDDFLGDDFRRTSNHLRDSEGRLITHFDEWLLAAEAGRWPVEVHGGK